MNPGLPKKETAKATAESLSSLPFPPTANTSLPWPETPTADHSATIASAAVNSKNDDNYANATDDFFGDEFNSDPLVASTPCLASFAVAATEICSAKSVAVAQDMPLPPLPPSFAAELPSPVSPSLPLLSTKATELSSRASPAVPSSAFVGFGSFACTPFILFMFFFPLLFFFMQG
jgi:hypothetical protein